MKKKNKTTSMIWEFLKGCRMMFLVSIFSAVIMALADMINPQIIRMAVDNVIGGNPSAVLRYYNEYCKCFWRIYIS